MISQKARRRENRGFCGSRRGGTDDGVGVCAGADGGGVLVASLMMEAKAPDQLISCADQTPQLRDTTILSA